MTRVMAYIQLALRVARGLLVGEKISSADGARRAFMMTCLQLARSDLRDENAAARLREFIETDRTSAERSMERMAGHRNGYVSDRAYRLLVAAMSGSEVGPMEPDLRERFNRERELGLMPVRDAFASLAEAVPGLADVAGDVERNPTTPVATHFDRVNELIDANRDRLGSHIATGLVLEYLSIVAGDTSRGDINTPYFSICNQPMVTMTKSKTNRQ